MLKGFKVKHVGKWFEFLEEADWASPSLATEIVPKGFYGCVHSYFTLFRAYGVAVYYPDKKHKKCEVEILEEDLEDIKKLKELDADPFKEQEVIKEETMDLPKKGARFQIDWQKMQAYIDKHKSGLSEAAWTILKEIRRLAGMGLDFKVTKNKFFDDDFDCYLIEVNTINGNYGPWNLSLDILEEVRRMYA